MNKLRDIAKIGKSVLVQLVGAQMNFKTFEYIEHIDEDICKCSNCPTYNLKNINPNNPMNKVTKEALSEIEELYCYGQCKEAIKSTTKTIYHNEANQFNLPKGSNRLSKLQIKQLILFHFYQVDKQGIVKNLSIKQIANTLNCTEKTVRATNEKLVEQEFIWISPMDNDRFTVLIKEYKTYHLTAKQGGNGYLNMSFDLFQNLLNITNVNSLRLEIRQIIHFDNYNINTAGTRPVEFTHKEIQRFLPNYVNYRGIIEDIISNQSESFDIIEKDSSIVFSLKEQFRPDNIIKSMSIDYSNKFTPILDEHIPDLSLKYKQDLIQMSFQYSFEVVYQAVEAIIEQYIKKDKETPNFGGLVRTISKNICDGKFYKGKLTA